MSGNRFDFLEIGEAVPPAPGSETGPLAGPTEFAPSLGQNPAANLGEGLAMAEVRITDPRGYGAFLTQVSEETAEGYESHRSDQRLPYGKLRVTEMFGQRGSKAGEFNFPAGLCVDTQGILFIADAYNHRVQRVTPQGAVAVIGGRGAGKGQFLSPQAVATDDWRAFYIVEQGNHRVQKYSVDGVLELMFGRLGHREGELHGPTGIAVAPGTGDIYVADTGNCRIQRFDCEGRFLALIGAPGGSTPPLSSPQALAIDASDNLFVADTFAHRIVRYDPLGRYIGQYGGRFGVAGMSGVPANQFYEPRALASDCRGGLFIADSGSAVANGFEAQGRLQAIETESGRVRATVEKPGRGVSPLIRPSGLAIIPTVSKSQRGDLYVSDTMNHRILRFVWE